MLLAKFALTLPAVTKHASALLGTFNSNDVYMYLSMYVCICLMDFLEFFKKQF